MLTKPFLCPQAFEWVIHAFLSSRLDYCNSLYYGINSTTLTRLQIVQNAAARLLKGTRKREHITPILASLHWLPVRFRVNFKIILFVYKCLNNLAPLYLSELLEHYNPSRDLRSGTQKLLSIPRYRLKHRGYRVFAIAGPTLWNSLPNHVRSAPDLSVFKSRLKTHFYSIAFNNL